MKKDDFPSARFKRPYGFQELALLYFPDHQPRSASNQLRRWIRFSPALTGLLLQSMWRPGRKVLTPFQVRLIVEHLGEP